MSRSKPGVTVAMTGHVTNIVVVVRWGSRMATQAPVNRHVVTK